MVDKSICPVRTFLWWWAEQLELRILPPDTCVNLESFSSSFLSGQLCSVLIFLPLSTEPVPCPQQELESFPSASELSHPPLLPFPPPISVQRVAYLERAEHGAKTNQYICTVNVRSRCIIQFTTAGWHFWDRCLRYRKGFSGLSDTWLLLGERYWGLCCFIRMRKEKAECTESQSHIYLHAILSAFSRWMF